jgi:hypothetical protein
MTPLRQKEILTTDLIGLRELADAMPDDPLAGPLAQSRIAALEEKIRHIAEMPSWNPEAEIFFGPGPAIGSAGLDAKFASRILNSYQDIVSNQFAATFHGALRRAGRRRGENDSRLYLTALPRGSFGLQLSQPHIEDFVAAQEVARVMEGVADLVAAASEDDDAFATALERFHPRVLTPLRALLETIATAGSDCRMISGHREASLSKEKVAEAAKRATDAKTRQDEVEFEGVFDGLLLQSGKFEFEPIGQSIVSGWLAEDVTDEQAQHWGALTGRMAKAKLRMTTFTTPNRQRRLAYELLSLEPINEAPVAVSVDVGI